MPRTLFAVSLLVLVVAAQGSLAGPPERVSGKMVLDEVADGLRHYRNGKDPEKRLELLTRLAATRDPRVTVELGEMLSSDSEGDVHVACMLILKHQFTRRSYSIGEFYGLPPKWWKENEADLRRRAKQLP